MKVNLFEIADFLLDDAIKEYRAINLRDTVSVQIYASHALDMYISDEEAQIILECCKNWINYDGNEASNDYYNIVEKPLCDI